MSSKTFAGLILFLPFCTLVESIGYFLVFDSSLEDPSVVETINTFWNFLAIFWCIPYGILVTWLLIWSRQQTIEQIDNRFRLAPTILMSIACGLYLLLALVMGLLGEHHPLNTYGGGTTAFLIMAAISIPASLGAGFGFVGLAFLLHRLFLKSGLLRD
jgi:uncharacterized membrane protein YidH (DUF202 family)